MSMFKEIHDLQHQKYRLRSLVDHSAHVVTTPAFYVFCRLVVQRMFTDPQAPVAGQAPASVTPSHERVQRLNADDDDAYVSSYSHFSIHEEMLQVRAC